MARKSATHTRIEAIASLRGQYHVEAYHLVLEALDGVMDDRPRRRHVSGDELLDGIRDCAMERFGPLAKDVLHHWGVHETIDFGQIVFQLIEGGLMYRGDDDYLSDFIDRFDFEQVFGEGYLRTRFVLRDA
jgi:uncharacterized repeat protein (TIGR04138 family)